MERIIRFFCMVGPKAPEGHTGLWWPDIAWSYANGLLATGISMRVFPIGANQMNARGDGYRHWIDLANRDLFKGEMAANFVNVVCAPACQNMTQERVFNAPRAGKIVLPAETSLDALWTNGHRNIAITDWDDAMAQSETQGLTAVSKEMMVLRRYDMVLVPGARQADVMRRLEVKAIHCDSQELLADAGIAKMLLEHVS